jgi:hypothetical protein
VKRLTELEGKTHRQRQAFCNFQHWRAAPCVNIQLTMMVPQSMLNAGKFPIEIKDFSQTSHKTHAKKTTLHRQHFQFNKRCF